MVRLPAASLIGGADETEAQCSHSASPAMAQEPPVFDGDAPATLH